MDVIDILYKECYVVTKRGTQFKGKLSDIVYLVNDVLIIIREESGAIYAVPLNSIDFIHFLE